jgi:hypothetical protein
MAMRSAGPPTVARMRPITLICALAAILQFHPSNALASTGWTWPIRGPVLTPYRNGGDPYAAGQHRGIDIGAPVGSRVAAAVAGTVTFAGVVGSSGLTVSERTADGRFDLSYLHLSSLAVQRGDVVTQGAPVGAVGVSGRRSVAAPHLHFGVREAGSRSAYRDPLDFLLPPAGDRVPRPVAAPVPVAHPAGPAPMRVPPHVAQAPIYSALPHAAPLGHRFPTHSAHRPHHVSGPLRAPDPMLGPKAVAAPAPAPPAPARPRAAHPDRGVNVGWLAALLGLVAAATALGRPDATRKLATRGRTQLTALVRPASRGG